MYDHLKDYLYWIMCPYLLELELEIVVLYDLVRFCRFTHSLYHSFSPVLACSIHSVCLATLTVTLSSPGRIQPGWQGVSG
jgi:hypothetical protein